MTLGARLLAVSLFMFWSIASIAETIVIVHPSNGANLDKKMVQRIFLGKSKKFSDGNATLPINQLSSENIRSDFDQTILGRSSSQVAAFWSKQVFTGKGVPPKEVANDQDVIELVSKNPHAIGYINSNSLNDSVKAVELN